MKPAPFQPVSMWIETTESNGHRRIAKYVDGCATLHATKRQAVDVIDDSLSDVAGAMATRVTLVEAGMGTTTVYRRADKKYEWRAVEKKSGNEVACSAGQGYENRAECVEMAGKYGPAGFHVVIGKASRRRGGAVSK